MKILYFYQYFGTANGSWSTRSYDFARRWVQAGDSVTVVTSVYDKSDLRPPGFLGRLSVEGIDVRMINIGLSNKHGKALRVLTFLTYAVVASLYSVIFRPDVILASSGPITVGIPALLGRFLRGTPFVFEVRDLWPDGAIQLGVLRNRFAIRAARILERLCYRYATAVVALSDGMAESLAARRVRGVSVIPNASNNDLFGPSDLAPRDTNHRHSVVYAGTLGLIDDCMQLVRMAEVLEGRGVHDIDVVLIGDGNEAGRIRRYVEQKSLANVRMLGLLPKQDLVSHLHEADAALMTVKPVPVLDTASPNKLFDAMAAGLPMIQTTQGWIRRLLEEEHCGLTTPPDDPEAMADAVVRLVRDPVLRAQMARNALRLARTRFDRDMLADRMRTVLARAAA